VIAQEVCILAAWRTTSPCCCHKSSSIIFQKWPIQRSRGACYDYPGNPIEPGQHLEECPSLLRKKRESAAVPRERKISTTSSQITDARSATKRREEARQARDGVREEKTCAKQACCDLISPGGCWGLSGIARSRMHEMRHKPTLTGLQRQIALGKAWGNFSADFGARNIKFNFRVGTARYLPGTLGCPNTRRDRAKMP
jgi:hypothetical protein